MNTLSHPEKPNGLVDREPEIPMLLSNQRGRIEELQILMDRLHSKLEPIMLPAVPSKVGGATEMAVTTGMGNLIDRANQDICATNSRLRDILDRLAI